MSQTATNSSSCWDSATDGDLPSSLKSMNNDQLRQQYLNFIKNKSRKTEDSIRSKLGMYLGPLPSEEQQQQTEQQQTKKPQQVGFNFSSSVIKITSSSTTLKGYRIILQQQQQQLAAARTAFLVIDTTVWNKVWEMFFNDEESQDKAFDLLQKEGRPQSARAVLLRLFPSRLAIGGGSGSGSGGVSSTMSQTALASLKKDVETQARACGPVEFVRIFDEKEILVQFTCETAAKLFQSTCSMSNYQQQQQQQNGSSSTSTAVAKPSGFLARVQNEFGVEDPRAVVTNAQRIDLVLALSSTQQQNHQQQNQQQQRMKKGGGGVLPALELSVTAEENSNVSIITSPSNMMNGGSNNSVSSSSSNNSSSNMNFSYGIQLKESFIKALFTAAGATEIKSVIFEHNNDATSASSSPTDVATTTPATPAVPTFKRFFMKFNNFKDAQYALHTLQFPLRRIFGLSLNFTADYPVAASGEGEQRGVSPKKKTIVVQGGTNTKFEDSD